MAPTDLLAKQHAETLHRFFAPHQIPVLLYTSSTRTLHEGGESIACTPEQARARIALGRIVVVGTHALLERGQAPPDSALVIVDEQHRFGVAQRETLTVSTHTDGKTPHLLSMSATPIPRSLSLALHGDLEVSLIRSKPKGRAPIKTVTGFGESGRELAYVCMREQIAQGHRAFVVCPLIDPSDTLGVKSVEAETKRLQYGPLQGLRIGMLHGKMSAKDKDIIMQDFVSGALDVLVATTVVEVGVDVPHATVMLIEGVERFGLAQLHQLRGRIGRSLWPSFCFLIASEDSDATRRMRVLERTEDGFEIAEEDLKIRGEGNLLGMQQSGRAIFRVARTDDLVLMAQSRQATVEILSKDPSLQSYPKLQQLVKTLQETSHQE
jgi:ATP-dependent DNA helicase RecG